MTSPLSSAVEEQIRRKKMNITSYCWLVNIETTSMVNSFYCIPIKRHYGNYKCTLTPRRICTFIIDLRSTNVLHTYAAIDDFPIIQCSGRKDKKKANEYYILLLFCQLVSCFIAFP